MVELLISDPGLRNALIENARNRIEEHHGCKTERDEYFKLIKELIGHDCDDDNNGQTLDSSLKLQENKACETTRITEKAEMF